MKTYRIPSAVLAVLVFTGMPAGRAQDFEVRWYTVDAGGGMFATANEFGLSGTVGQADANVTAAADGDFALAGGFWPGVEELCFGDLTGDYRVDLDDLAQMLGNYGMSNGMTYEDGDLDGDGDVDLDDLAEMMGLYGTVCIIGCPGDLDGDGVVNLSDLAQLVGHYGTTSGASYTDGDLDLDGDVDLNDLAELLGVYGTTCP